MNICKNCNEKFDIPETKRPDAGHVITPYELRYNKVKPVQFCPYCFSTNIGVQNPVMNCYGY
ncbi:hypothetical protein [Anaerosporobacter sp.]|uniref:hypothetical protein n=1 Tax=Anaerosporobacter sp. TaxID=1872529 RepID=UPI00286F7635|nr:hypothetical protein [Anaerosporobacter sp.]